MSQAAPGVKPAIQINASSLLAWYDFFDGNATPSRLAVAPARAGFSTALSPGFYTASFR